MNPVIEGRYSVPVYRFDDEAGEEEIAQVADEDADEYVEVSYVERQMGDPAVRVTHVHGDETDRYRFRLVDAEVGWCVYRGGQIDDVPVCVQHALTACEVGIQGVGESDDLYYRWLEAHAINRRVQWIGDEVGNSPLMEKLVRDTQAYFSSIITLLLARDFLSEREYRDIWHSVEYRDEPNYDETLLELFNAYDDAIEHTDSTGLLKDVQQLTRFVSFVSVDEVMVDGATILIVDFIFEEGSRRFQFQVTGEGMCVHQKPTGVHVPSTIVRRLDEIGYSVKNADSIVVSQSPSEASEMAGLFLISLRDGILFPDDFDPDRMNPVDRIYGNVDLMSLTVVLYEMEKEQFRKLDHAVSKKMGIVDADNLTVETLGEALLTIVSMLPNSVRVAWKERIHSHPAHQPPEMF